MMTRRKGIIFVALVLLAAGCGGGGGGGMLTTPTRTLNGVVQLPQGSKTSLSTLTVITPGGTSRLGSNGQFVQNAPESGPAFSEVVDANGKVILMGFLDPANSQSANAISCSSTALALEFFDLGGFTLPQNQYSHILALLSAQPDLKQLTTTLQTRICQNVEALANGDQIISTQLQGTTQALLPGSGIAAASPAILSRSETAKLAGITVTRAPTTDKKNTPPLSINIAPDDPSQAGGSGVTLSQSSDDTGVVATNHLRRSSKLYLIETSYTDSAGTHKKIKTIDLNKSKKTKTTQSDYAMEVPETTALGGIPELFTDVFKKKTPWAPVSTDTIPTPLDSSTGTTKTTYWVVDAGPMPTDYVGVPAPLIWNNPDALSYHEPWTNDMQTETVTTAVRALLLPLILSVSELTPTGATEAEVEVITANVAATTAKYASGAGTLFLTGQFQAAMKTIVAKMAEQPQMIEELVQDIASAAPESRRPAGVGSNTAIALLSNFCKMSKLTIALNSLARAVDLGAVIKDNLTASPIEAWDLTIFTPTVRLQPSAVEVGAGQTSTPMSVTTSEDQSALGKSTLAFVWSSTGLYGTIQDNLGNTGTTTITSIPTVAPYTDSLTYKANANAQIGNSDTITVKAYVKPENSSNDPSTWEYIGKAQATVTIGQAGTYSLCSSTGGPFIMYGCGELELYLNGVQIYEDSGGVVGAGQPKGPIQFSGATGDTFNIQIRAWYPYPPYVTAGISTVYLSTPSGKLVFLMNQFIDQNPPQAQATIVLNKTFTLP